MQTAKKIMVALGGDKGTTVPKYDVTASEIAVLMAIHGNDAVHDIEPGEDIERSDREEIARLAAKYGRAKVHTEDGDTFVMKRLFPGHGARAVQTLEELAIPEEFYKAESRVKPKAVPEEKKGRRKKADDPVQNDEPVSTDGNIFDE